MSGTVSIDVLASGSEENLSVIRIPSFSRDGFLSRIPVVSRQAHRGSYYWEAASFTLAALPVLLAKKYDVLHVMDPPVLNALFRIRSKVGLRSPIVFTNGVGMIDEACLRADHLHQVSQAAFAAMEGSLAPERMTLIPYPVDPALVDIEESTSEARSLLGLPPFGRVVLSVAAMNRGHKRTDHLIEEVAACPGVSLVVVGRAEEPDLLQLAERKLGNRFFHREITFDRIGLAYRAADIFVSTSLIEGFGISLVESMMAGCPVLAHDNQHFRWLIGDGAALVDMSEPGALARALDAALRDSRRDPNDIRRDAIRRFSWQELVDEYAAMYHRVAQVR